MDKIKKILTEADKIVNLILRWIAIVSCAGMFFILLWNIVARIDFNPANMVNKNETAAMEKSSDAVSESGEEDVDIFSMMKKVKKKKVVKWGLPTLKWQTEIIAWLFGWMIFFGSVSLWRGRDHFKIDWLFDKIVIRRYGFIFQLALETISLIFLFLLGYYGINHTAVNARQMTQILNIPLSPTYICIPISAFLMSIYSVRNIVQIIAAVIKGEYDPLKDKEEAEKLLAEEN